jgi:WhiB family redox-sensing transcriptional regulator
MTDWTLDALCSQTDPEIFFPEKGGNPAPAKAICHSCSVVNQCRTYALADPSIRGVWGGTTFLQRKQTRGAMTRLEGGAA